MVETVEECIVTPPRRISLAVLLKEIRLYGGEELLVMNPLLQLLKIVLLLNIQLPIGAVESFATIPLPRILPIVPL